MTVKDNIIWYMKEKKANNDLSKVSYKQFNDNGVIKVGFIVNMPEVWDKERPVFESMIEDSSFAPLLIVVPAFDVAASAIGDYGSEWDYFYGLYGEKYTVRAKENDQYVDLKQYGFDYVFYQRPYENYLPGQYHTSPVSRYAKTCYIPYFLPGSSLDKSYYKTNFFRYLQVFFCSTEEQMKYAGTASARKNVFLGYPAIEGIEIDKSDISDKAILYTPRWSEALDYGGTSFYRFKDSFPDLGKTVGENVNVIFRPHPLMFSNAVKTGRMTEQEVSEYKQRLSGNKILIDNNKDYMKTFAETGILLTDRSSIVLNFFLTGKPVIYCTTLEGFPLSYISRIMFDNIYMAQNWEAAVGIIKDLRRGRDPLKESRLKCIEKIVCGSGSVEKIKNYLKTY